MPLLRPPGSAPDMLLRERCTSCGDCAEVCPKEIIHLDAEGHPAIDPSGAVCTGCGLCGDVCSHGAIEDPG
jgi:MinD superfamily P-loop ATPase